ncbi:hypothetical protein Salat_0970200 [Sesamum alatum]|uniref:Uncharacterized protein n=1 Tax=Sesamum alatum TaxID=300844 RepID=A0AAE2CRP7_9LAMI|nr:hypothetical protein Salat_0970200 [Sesamum alatum]
MGMSPFTFLKPTEQHSSDKRTLLNSSAINLTFFLKFLISYGKDGGRRAAHPRARSTWQAANFVRRLQLPICFVTNNAKVFFSNVIAFEMSPETCTDYSVLSYLSFMKSLIENVKDVKELREKGILFSCLGSDEEVVKVFKEIDTHGMDYLGAFRDVKMRIEEHCNSKAKTWMAELIHTYFRSPWTATSLFATILLLCLTFLQTYYTIHPAKNN